MAVGIQRPLKGSRISSFYPVKELPALSSLDSAFQLQEYISLLIRLDVHDVEAITSLPDDKDVTVDQWCWIYEQLRRLAQDLTHPLITTLQQECNRATCPEMKAGEWLYLCVAHGNEGSMEQCCAVDYILHTLDSATALLNSPRAFPSRLQIPESSQRHFSSLARRLGRIFAHAYFHHREAFEQAEAESSLYARFLALTSKFDLVPPEFLPIPPEALYGAGASGDADATDIPRDAPPPKLLGAGLEPQQTAEGGTTTSSTAAASDTTASTTTTRDTATAEVDVNNIHERQQQIQQAQLQAILSHEPVQVQVAVGGVVPESPRRGGGRNRTDTMVFSEAEASSFAEQYAAAVAREAQAQAQAAAAAPASATATATATAAVDPAPNPTSDDDEPAAVLEDPFEMLDKDIVGAKHDDDDSGALHEQGREQEEEEEAQPIVLTEAALEHAKEAVEHLQESADPFSASVAAVAEAVSAPEPEPAAAVAPEPVKQEEPVAVDVVVETKKEEDDEKEKEKSDIKDAKEATADEGAATKDSVVAAASAALASPPPAVAEKQEEAAASPPPADKAEAAPAPAPEVAGREKEVLAEAPAEKEKEAKEATKSSSVVDPAQPESAAP